MKKQIYIVIYFFLLLFLIPTLSFSSYKKEGIENFPDSYKPYLRELQKRHPNWSFTALYTELDWGNVINNENKFGLNLVPKSYSDNWKNTKARTI